MCDVVLACIALVLTLVCLLFLSTDDTDHPNKSHKILWEDPRDIKAARITFTGVPFIILGRKVYDCQHGIDRKAGEKRKLKEAKEVKKKDASYLHTFSQDIRYYGVTIANIKPKGHRPHNISMRDVI